jgi:hypothetical protein
MSSEDAGTPRRLTPRHRLAHDTAEQIAAAADRLENQAAEVRAINKHLALRILKEASRLRQYARTLDVQHKRAIRVMMDRLRGGADHRGNLPNAQ